VARPIKPPNGSSVSVVDTTSIDLTFTDGDLSASVIFGASAGTVAEGNHTHDAASVTGFNEAAQDAVGTILVDTASIDLTYNDATPSITAAAIFGTTSTTIAAGNHAHTVPGATTQVIFNDAGVLAGDAGLTYNKTTDALTVVGSVQANNIGLGSNPAVAGQVRLPNTGTIYGRNAANSGDVVVFQVGGDDNIYAGPGAIAQLRANGIALNQGGIDADTVIKGDTDANLLFVDASTDRVGIGTATPAKKLDVVGSVGVSGSVDFPSSTGQKIQLYAAPFYGLGVEGGDLRIATGSSSADKVSMRHGYTGTPFFEASDTAIVLNGGGLDNDTQIKGDTDANLLYADASTDRVGVGTATPATKLDVVGGGAFTGDVTVPDEVYGVGWDGSLEVPTKNSLYDKIQTLGGGGVNLTGMTLLSETPFSAVSSVSLPNNTFSSTYENYRVVVTVDATSVLADLLLRFRVAGTDDSGASSYNYSLWSYTSTATSGAAGAAATSIKLYSGGTAANNDLDLDFTIYQPLSASTRSALSGTAQALRTALDQSGQVISGQYGSDRSHDSFTLLPSAGTMTGTVRVYGLQNTPGAAGSGAFPAGSNTHVQFNDAGNLGGDAGLTYNKTTDALTIAGNISITGAAGQTNVISATGVDQDTRIAGVIDTNLLFVDASTDRVGIGTATPAAKLDVVGTAQISGAVTHGNLAGTGTRPVMASSSGLLSAPTDFTWRFEAASDGSSVTTNADTFGANSAITTEASTRYEFEALIFYRRGVAGTTTFSFVNTQTYTRINVGQVTSPAAGMGSNATSLGISGIEGVTAATASLPASASQTLNTDQFAILRGNFTTNAAGTWRIRWTTSAGDIVLQAGSFFSVKKVPAAQIGTFVA
jgi:hypothetical protein